MSRASISGPSGPLPLTRASISGPSGLPQRNRAQTFGPSNSNYPRGSISRGTGSRASVSVTRPSTANSAATAEEILEEETFPGGIIAEKLFERRSEFLHYQSCKIKVGTWNVATSESTEEDIAKWLVDDYKPKPDVNGKRRQSTIGKWYTDSVARRNRILNKRNADEGHDIPVEEDDNIGIYVICLQEVVDVSATETFLKSSNSKVKNMWEEYITVSHPLSLVHG